MTSATTDRTRPDTVLTALATIGEAAELVGVSRAMLRIWEREQLIRPTRSPGGHRLYSADDMDRMREIFRLRTEERLNAAAIRRELGPIGLPDGSVERDERQPDVGGRLRELRAERGWSLAEVSHRSGLSVSFLSSVERGTSSISVGNLFKLADAYGTTVPGLGPDRPPGPRSMVHPGDRRQFVAASGRVLIEDLIASPGALEAQRIEVQPGGGSGEAYTHPGEEFIYVLDGCLGFLIDEAEEYRLGEGDSLCFRSERSHRWWNDGDTAAIVLWINVPLVGSLDNPPRGR